MSEVFWNASDDPEMDAAYAKARENFKYFWREMNWEFRRIVPGLSYSQVKMRFYDVENDVPLEDKMVEYMWADIHDFDGQTIYGELLNEPHHLQEAKQGDKFAKPFHDMIDWLYGMEGQLFGGYTINLMRSRMGKGERKAHDKAWGIDFGDPEIVDVVPSDWLIDTSVKKGLFRKAAYLPAENVEHPMALHMAAGLREDKFEGFDVSILDAHGAAPLHHMALAGAFEACTALLEKGADKSLKNVNGHTACDLAEMMGWPKLAAALSL